MTSSSTFSTSSDRRPRPASGWSSVPALKLQVSYHVGGEPVVHWGESHR